MTEQLRPQRRSRRIAMSGAEVDAFLAEQRTCRVATSGPDGPHATPLWFHWDGRSLWLSSLTRSQRWTDLQRDPRIGVVVDAGEEYLQLRGVEITGSVEVVGEVPRTGEPDEQLDEVVGEVPRTGEPDEQLDEVEAAFQRKYDGGRPMSHDGRHAWLRLTPTKIASWDFRKI